MDSPRDIDNAKSLARAASLARMADGADFWWPVSQAPASAKGRAFRDHWLSLRDGQEMPPRSALDPVDIAPLLPHIVLVEVLRDPLRFRYRLIGTFVTGLAGRDATGQLLDHTLYGRNLGAVVWPYQQVVERREPVATLSGLLFADRDWQCVENMFVPFREDGEGGESGEVAKIAVCIDVNANRGQHDLTSGLVIDWRG